LTSDLGELLRQAAAGRIESEPAFDAGASVTVVLASDGYPVSPRTGDIIEGFEEANTLPGVTVFCAGVGRNDDGRLVTAGGRVLNVTGVGASIEEARKRAYAAVERIAWPGMHHRADIAEVAGSTGT
jgi:phosphoribosylamine--glycine ligase